MAANWLKSVSYYRMSGYWLPFEEPTTGNQTRSKKFLKGTKFDDVMALYIFDRTFRLTIMEAVERVEIALRARWTYRMVEAYGSHVHMQPDAFKLDYRNGIYWSMMNGFARGNEKSDEVFVKHYAKKYTTPEMPPLWAMTELLTFGELSIWIAMTKSITVKTELARDMGLGSPKNLEGVIQNIALVRNKCAHHSRVWNRRFMKRIPGVKILRSSLVFDSKGQGQADNRIYNTLIALIHMLRQQAADTSYATRLTDIIRLQSPEKQSEMGFPENWETLPIWN
jgi:abortive infection bacteriophage resistance protein